MISPVLERSIKLANEVRELREEGFSAAFSADDVGKFVTIRRAEMSKVHVHVSKVTINRSEGRAVMWGPLTGLQWHDAGAEKPAAPRSNDSQLMAAGKQQALLELQNRGLRHALKARRDFERTELQGKFGLDNVHMNRFVVADGKYFQPEDPHPGDIDALPIMAVQSKVGGVIVVGEGDEEVDFLNPQRPQTALAVLAPDRTLGRSTIALDKATDVVGFALSRAVHCHDKPTDLPSLVPEATLVDVAANCQPATQNLFAPTMLQEVRSVRSVWRLPHTSSVGGFKQRQSDLTSATITRDVSAFGECGALSHRGGAGAISHRSHMPDHEERDSFDAHSGHGHFCLSSRNAGNSKPIRKFSQFCTNEQSTGAAAARARLASRKEATGLLSYRAREHGAASSRGPRRLSMMPIRTRGRGIMEEDEEATKHRRSAVQELMEEGGESKQGPGRSRLGGSKPTVASSSRLAASKVSVRKSKSPPPVVGMKGRASGVAPALGKMQESRKSSGRSLFGGFSSADSRQSTGGRQSTASSRKSSIFGGGSRSSHASDGGRKSSIFGGGGGTSSRKSSFFGGGGPPSNRGGSSNRSGSPQSNRSGSPPSNRANSVQASPAHLLQESPSKARPAVQLGGGPDPILDLSA